MIIKVTKSGFRWAQLNSLEHDKIVDAIKHAFEGVGSDEKHRAARIKVKMRKYTRNPSKTLFPSYSLGSRNLRGRKVSNLKQITPRLEITKVLLFFFQRGFKINSFPFKPSWMEIVCQPVWIPFTALLQNGCMPYTTPPTMGTQHSPGVSITTTGFSHLTSSYLDLNLI